MKYLLNKILEELGFNDADLTNTKKCSKIIEKLVDKIDISSYNNSIGINITPKQITINISNDPNHVTNEVLQLESDIRSGKIKIGEKKC